MSDLATRFAEAQARIKPVTEAAMHAYITLVAKHAP
jgi:hypothetical protein